MKKVTERKTVFRFSLRLLSAMFPNVRRIQWHTVCHRRTHIALHAHAQYRNSCRILTKLEFSRNIFGKYSNTKFHENPSSGSRVFHADGRTDRLDEAQSLLAIVRSRPESSWQHSQSVSRQTHDPSISRLQGTFETQPTATSIILVPLIYGKGKGKVTPRTGHKHPEMEQMYSSTLSLTSALCRFNPVKDPIPIV